MSYIYICFKMCHLSFLLIPVYMYSVNVNFRVYNMVIGQFHMLLSAQQNKCTLGVPGWLSRLCLTLAQVMILQFVGLSLALGSLLSVWSLLWILCPIFSLPLPHSHCLALKNRHFKN